MRLNDVNTKIETLIGEISRKKNEYKGSPIGSTGEARYWRLDGVEEGLLFAWDILNLNLRKVDYETLSRRRPGIK